MNHIEINLEVGQRISLNFSGEILAGVEVADITKEGEDVTVWVKFYAKVGGKERDVPYAVFNSLGKRVHTFIEGKTLNFMGTNIIKRPVWLTNPATLKDVEHCEITMGLYLVSIVWGLKTMRLEDDEE